MGIFGEDVLVRLPEADREEVLARGRTGVRADAGPSDARVRRPPRSLARGAGHGSGSGWPVRWTTPTSSLRSSRKRRRSRGFRAPPARVSRGPEVIRMRVKFVGGPLDGREEEISDDKLEEDHPVYWPERPDVDDDTDPDQPGTRRASSSTSTRGTGRRSTSAGSSRGRNLGGCPSRPIWRSAPSACSPARSTGPGGAGARGDEEDALEALLAYGPRYAGVLKGSGVRFTPPAKASTFEVVERLTGDATTDFGAPSIAPKADARPVDRRWLARNEKILRGMLERVRSRGREASPGP